MAVGPLMTFDVEGSTIRVAAEIEARPSSRRTYTGEVWHETVLDLPADPEIVRAATADLRPDLVRHLARGERINARVGASTPGPGSTDVPTFAGK